MSTANPNAAGKRTDYADFGAYVASCSDLLSRAYARKLVTRDRLPMIPADRTSGAALDTPASIESIVNAVSAVPLVVIPGVSYEEQMSYLCVVFRSTVAAIRAFSPTLSSAMLTPLGRTLVAVTVAMRCGVWHSTGVGPSAEPHPVSACFKQRKGKPGLYRAGLDPAGGLAQWYVAYTSVDPASALMEELMHRLAYVAPVVLDMQCAESARQSSSYAIPYVQQAVSRYLKAKLSKDAYPLAMLDRNVVWATMRQACVAGMPSHAVRQWATDAVFHNQAHRRLLSTSAELAASRRQEDALRASQDPEGIDYACDGTSIVDDEFAVAVRAARPRALSDDLKTVGGESAWSDEEQELPRGRSVSPRPVITAMPSRQNSPPPEMTAADAETVRQAVRNAQGTGEIAASVLAGAQENLTVVW